MIFNLPSLIFVFVAGLFIGFAVMIYAYRDWRDPGS